MHKECAAQILMIWKYSRLTLKWEDSAIIT